MLAASICREVQFTVLSSTTMASRVPRCLFGKPNSRETVEMLQEALDTERSKFVKRWGVDPRSEDKENNYQRKHHDKHEPSPKKRTNPYSRQTSIHDYWRARKVCEVNKKSLTSSLDASKQQNEASKTSKTTTTMTTSTTTTTMTTAMKSSKKASQN